MSNEMIGIIVAIVVMFIGIGSGISKHRKNKHEMKQREQKWDERYRWGHLAEDDKKLEIYPFSNPQLNQEVRLMLIKTKKIQAIKVVRDRNPGLELREAKEYVDAVQRSIRY